MSQDKNKKLEINKILEKYNLKPTTQKIHKQNTVQTASRQSEKHTKIFDKKTNFEIKPVNKQIITNVNRDVNTVTGAPNTVTGAPNTVTDATNIVKGTVVDNETKNISGTTIIKDKIIKLDTAQLMP